MAKEKLEKENITVWKAASRLKPGQEWRNEIDSALLDADVILIMLDQNSAASPYVTYEWAFALGSGKLIFPLLVDECEVHPRLKVLQYLDFKNRPWSELIALIKKTPSPKKGNLKVSDLTIDELENILARSRALITTKESENSSDTNIASMVNKLANAKSSFQDVLEKSNMILWVDDRPDNNIYERGALETIGFSFDLALSTDEAISCFRENNYIAIISDMGRKARKRVMFSCVK